LGGGDLPSPSRGEGGAKRRERGFIEPSPRTRHGVTMVRASLAAWRSWREPNPALPRVAGRGLISREGVWIWVRLPFPIASPAFATLALCATAATSFATRGAGEHTDSVSTSAVFQDFFEMA
jgi:hypothetical protein